MIRGLFDLLHSLSILQREVREHVVHEGLLLLHALDRGRVLRDNTLVEKRLEPVKLDIHTEAHQSVLGEIRPQ